MKRIPWYEFILPAICIIAWVIFPFDNINPIKDHLGRQVYLFIGKIVSIAVLLRIGLLYRKERVHYLAPLLPLLTASILISVLGIFIFLQLRTALMMTLPFVITVSIIGVAMLIYYLYRLREKPGFYTFAPMLVVLTFVIYQLYLTFNILK
jgi:hypothetical protein